MPSFNVDASFISAVAAAISAVFAGLVFLFSRRLSRREMVDALKLEILRVVSSVQGRHDWQLMVMNSTIHEGGGVGPIAETLAVLLPRKYRKKKWVNLIPPALEELKQEGHRDKLGL